MLLKQPFVKVCLCSLLLFLTLSIQAQETKEITEAKSKLAKATTDSVRIGALVELADGYRHISDNTSAKKYADEALAKAKAAHILFSYSKRIVALVYRDMGENEKSLSLFKEALADAKKEKSKKSEANVLNDMAMVYYNSNRIDSALSYFIIATNIRQQIGDSAGLAVSSNNIGQIYKSLKDEKKAMEYFNRALEMFRGVGKEFQVALVLNNIGNIYDDVKNYKEALRYYLESLAILEKLEKKKYIAQFKMNIGNTYKNLGQLEKAEQFLNESANMMEALGDKSGLCRVLGSIADFYFFVNKTEKAKAYNEKCIPLAIETGDMEILKNAYFSMSKCYERIGDYKLAHYYYLEQDAIQDSLAELTSQDLVKKMSMEYETEKKELQIKGLQSEQALSKAEAGRQKTQKMLLLTGLVAALLVGILFLYGFVQKRKDNQVIALQKEEVEKQKELLEERNKDITDSINYAKRIQHAILKSEEHVSQHLPPHFILFKPKDIVSGDFYWALEKQDHLYLAAADCTGHGVPGAFLTMLGASFLNEINANEKLLSTAEILDKLRDKMIKELGQTGAEGENKDGMDISFSRLNLKTKELQWSGANNPLYYIQNKQMKEIKGDKQPIGHYTDMKPFTNQELQLGPGDSFYLFTDGYADQFGGPQGKKFKYKQLQQLLLKNIHLSQEAQKQLLSNTFEMWRGGLEQVDDVCVIGVTLA
jgi:serine phosphatase RsbU (regulator of sigma subunit)